MSTKQPKIPQRVQRVVNRVAGGETLCRYIRPKATGEADIVFFFEPGGRHCPAKSAMDAIKSGLLKPSGDGLFGDQDSQTWVAS